jgi:hypothetical protein
MKRKPLLILLSFLLLASCSLHNGQQAPTAGSTDRPPAVAGQFYPAKRDELQITLKDLFSKAVPSKGLKNVVAIISPHAGYIYSGSVAASAFNQIDTSREYDNIFILGPSHHVGFEGAQIYCKGNFVTPLGTVKVNIPLAQQLIRKTRVFSDRTDAHVSEHSIEVQLPFLQYLMKRDFKIVPIVIGSSSAEVYAQIADALRPYLNSRNLFIISTDFSHYPAYSDAMTVDKATADAIVTNSPGELIKAIRANDARRISNLATSLCGVSGVLTLLYMTENNPNVSYTDIQYKNSGDLDPSLRSQVVGYHAMAVTLHGAMPVSDFQLTGEDKSELLKIARNAVEQFVRNRTVSPLDTLRVSDNLRANRGAFVTLKIHDQLRGCLGRFEATEPLFSVIRQMAIASATEDTRFSPVTPDELKKIDIEISVLTPMRRIRSIKEIELGKHGIYIRKGGNSGTFLPQVATETGWTLEEFLGHCAQDKARLGWNGWKDAEIYTYEAIVFGELDRVKR